LPGFLESNYLTRFVAGSHHNSSLTDYNSYVLRESLLCFKGYGSIIRRMWKFGKLGNCILGLFMYSAATTGRCTAIEEEEGNGE